jgi:hypothetical protein
MICDIERNHVLRMPWDRLTYGCIRLDREVWDRYVSVGTIDVWGVQGKRVSIRSVERALKSVRTLCRLCWWSSATPQFVIDLALRIIYEEVWREKLGPVTAIVGYFKKLKIRKTQVTFPFWGWIRAEYRRNEKQLKVKWYWIEHSIFWYPDSIWQ